jgi:EpsI family protein
MLVTYYVGDRAGHQLHDHAGYLEVAFAFGGFFVLDAILVRALKVTAGRAARATLQVEGHQDGPRRMEGANWRYLAASVVMLSAALQAVALAPTRYAVQKSEIDLEALIPRKFGDWREVESALIPMDLTPRDGEAATMDQPYDQTLQRTYVRSDGQRVMLALAYGRVQRQEVKIHRPELCYVAQGFEVGRKETVALSFGEDLAIDAVRLIARRPHRLEPVTYWVRIGSTIPQNAWQSRWEILRSGLQGYIPDGMLVRVSQALEEHAATDGSYEVQSHFLADLLAEAGPGTRRLLAGPGTRR